MKFRAAVLNKVNEPLTLDTLEVAALALAPRCCCLLTGGG